MKKFPPLPLEYIRKRLRVNVTTGRCFWRDATKHHRNLVGKEAGYPRNGRGKFYWIVKIDSLPYRRAQIVYTVKTGSWPKMNLDHKNGNSLDDRSVNLRPATFLQNARNRKSAYPGKVLPMGVRERAGRFQARIRVNGKGISLGWFSSASSAAKAYRAGRKQYFGEFS